MARSALDDNPALVREAAIGLMVLCALFVVLCSLVGWRIWKSRLPTANLAASGPSDAPGETWPEPPPRAPPLLDSPTKRLLARAAELRRALHAEADAPSPQATVLRPPQAVAFSEAPPPSDEMQPALLTHRDGPLVAAIPPAVDDPLSDHSFPPSFYIADVSPPEALSEAAPERAVDAEASAAPLAVAISPKPSSLQPSSPQPSEAFPRPRREEPEPLQAIAAAPATAVRATAWTEDRAAPRQSNAVYTVAENETLFDIARRELGQASRYAEIYRLNEPLLLRDFNRPPMGAALKMPPDWRPEPRLPTSRHPDLDLR